MSDKIKEIKETIWDFMDGNGDIEENEEEITDIYELIEYINEKFNCNIELKKVGSFDSPGYDLTCYAWAGIIDNELYFDTLAKERY